MVDAEQARDGVGHLGRVERADEREVAAGGVGEAGDRAVGSAVGTVAHANTVPEVPSEIATSPGRSASAERRGHVVAGAATPPSRAATAAGRAGPVDGGVDDREQVEPVLRLGRRPVAGARRVAAVGDELAGQPPREPVVREQTWASRAQTSGSGGAARRAS